MRKSWTQIYCYLVAIGVVLGVLWFLGALLVQSIPVWKHSGWDFVTGLTWFYRQSLYGALPMIYGTVWVSGIALLLALPLAIGGAIFTSEILPRKWRFATKLLVELLAGIPSVIYGLLGIALLRDWIYDWFEAFDVVSGDTLLTAGLLLGVMILPTVFTLIEDVFRSISGKQRQAARALGLTSAEVTTGVVLPQALPGIVSAVLLGLGRAMGETIAVFLVVGRQDHQSIEWLSLRPLLEAGQTLTSKLGGSEINLAYGDPLHWGAMMGLALVLLVMVSLSTGLSLFFRRRWV